MFIPNKDYDKIKEYLPILCVDLIVRNTEGQYLLVKRNNAPLKGEWWVIGGRVLKEETIASAARRKAMEEVGIFIADLNQMGYYEEVFNEGVHTVSIVFTAKAASGDVILDDQSAEYKWSDTLPKSFLSRLLSI